MTKLTYNTLIELLTSPTGIKDFGVTSFVPISNSSIRVGGLRHASLVLEKKPRFWVFIPDGSLKARMDNPPITVNQADTSGLKPVFEAADGDKEQLIQALTDFESTWEAHKALQELKGMKL